MASLVNSTNNLKKKINNNSSPTFPKNRRKGYDSKSLYRAKSIHPDAKTRQCDLSYSAV